LDIASGKEKDGWQDANYLRLSARRILPEGFLVGQGSSPMPNEMEIEFRRALTGHNLANLE